jgi:hypothetical protein
MSRSTPRRWEAVSVSGGAVSRINIDDLGEAELIDLNHRIVERLRFLRQMRAHTQMLEFRIGDRVTFQPEGLPPVIGMLTRDNRKSVTVITNDGHRWNVAPALLRRVESAAGAARGPATVLRLKHK